MDNKKVIVWLCVDSNGDEKLTSNSEGWQRFSPSTYYNQYEDYEAYKRERRKIISFDATQMKYDHWVEYHNEYDKEAPKTGFAPHWCYLPKGSIKKLIGRELTWEDEPVKLEEL